MGYGSGILPGVRPPPLVAIPTALSGPRVLLRPYLPRDAAAFLEAIEESRAHLEPWLPWVQSVRSLADARADLAKVRSRWRARVDLAMGIFHRETGRLLGGSGLHRIDWTMRMFEIGYWIRAAEEGRGYVTEAVQLLTRLAFEGLQAARVEIRMDPRNVRSRRVASRLGFVLEGTLRRCAAGPAGRPADRHVFALIPEDCAALAWLARSGGGARDDPS